MSKNQQDNATELAKNRAATPSVIIKAPSREAFQLQHVQTLKPIRDWDNQDEESHLKHNRILQPGFTDLFKDPSLTVFFNIDTPPAAALIQLARDTGEDWLTDFICPSVENACRLNIAADLVTRFKVSSDDLDSKTQEILQWIKNNQTSFTTDIQDEFTRAIKTSEFQEKIDEAAKAAFAKFAEKHPEMKLGDPGTETLFNKFRLVERERAKKNLLNKLLEERLQDIYPSLLKDLKLTEKPTYPIGTNNDICCLGAAGSGKSSIVTKSLDGSDKLNLVSLATDDYRGVTLAAEKSDNREAGFIRTQDSAYMIKELVEQRLRAMSERPDVLIDCVSLEGWHRKLLENNASTISMVACLDDMEAAIRRAYTRGMKAENAADKRLVHTPSLITGHAKASHYLLTSIPYHVETLLYDTNVPKGNRPNLMAAIDTRENKHEVTIVNLGKLASFLVKSNLNPKATSRGELYRDESQGRPHFTASLHDQAEACLDLVRAAPPFKPDNYILFLKGEADTQPYASISMQSGKLTFTVLDQEALDQRIKQDNDDAKILKKMLVQIYYDKTYEIKEPNALKATAKKWEKQQMGSENAEHTAIRYLTGVKILPAYYRDQQLRQEWKEKQQRSQSAPPNSQLLTTTENPPPERPRSAPV